MFLVVAVYPLEVVSNSILFLNCSHAFLDSEVIASPANLIDVIVLRIALLGMLLATPNIFL